MGKVICLKKGGQFERVDNPEVRGQLKQMFGESFSACEVGETLKEKARVDLKSGRIFYRREMPPYGDYVVATFS